MENNDEESLPIQLSPDIVYQQDKAQIDIQISTAKAYPRNIKKASDNAVAIATIDLATADRCNYSLPRGGKPITGPSIHLAKILAQCWGNMRVEAKVVDIGERQITSESVAFDLENNLAIKTQVKRSIMYNETKWDESQKKMVRTGRMLRMNDDMITVTGNAANSISMRNAILSVIPRGIVDKAYNAAKRMITGDLSDADKLIAKRKAVFDGFRDTYGVSEKEVLQAIGKAAIEHVTPDDIVVLIGIGTAIKDGDTTVDQAFKGKNTSTPPPPSEITLEELKELYEKNFPVLGKKTDDNAKRIIEKQEVGNYDKIAAEIRQAVAEAEKGS